MNQFRQNTLLAVTTLDNYDKVEAASELKCFHPGVKLQEALKLLLSRYFLFREEPDKESKTAINLLYSKYWNLVELNMVKLTEMQNFALRTLIKEINSGHFGLTNKAFLESLYGILLYVRKEEYFGRLRGKTQKFIIRMDLRPKRNHFEKYIGVGYKDKGTAKEESWDGFHSWQEITSTGKSKLNEVIRANSHRLQGKSIKSARYMKSYDLDIDSFGNPVRAHLEKVIIDNRWVAWREFQCTDQLREKLLLKIMAPIHRKYREKLQPARDSQGTYLYIEGSLN